MTWQCAGIVGVNPGAFTLRELAVMAEERGRDEWLRAASLMAHVANLHRDPKKGRPRRPADYFPFPWRRATDRPERIEVGIGVLRDVFVKKG